MGISKVEVWIQEVPISWSCGSSTWSQTFYKSWTNHQKKLHDFGNWSLPLQVLDKWSPFDTKVSYKSWSVVLEICALWSWIRAATKRSWIHIFLQNWSETWIVSLLPRWSHHRVPQKKSSQKFTSIQLWSQSLARGADRSTKSTGKVKSALSTSSSTSLCKKAW